VGYDPESPHGPWSLFFDLLAVAAGAGVILLMLHWLGLVFPLLYQIGLA